MIMIHKKRFKRQNQKGFTLLEILVALVLLGLGFGGMLMLQYKSLQFSSISYYRGISSQVISGLAASIRANSATLAAYDNVGGTYTYNPNGGVDSILAPTTNCVGVTTCTPTQVALEDIYWARRAVRAQLPGGDLYVKYDSTEQSFNVIVLWQDPENNSLTRMPCTGTGIAGLTAETTCLSMKVRI